MIIYLDNAASTPIDPRILDYIHDLNSRIYANPSSIHRLGQEANKLLKQARKTVADYISASPEEIIFCSGASEINNSIIKITDPDLIISSTIEHSCMLEAIKHSKKQIEWLEVNQQGYIDLEDLEQKLKLHKNKKILVTIMHGNNEIGSINEINSIKNICKQFSNIIFHSDCVQTFMKHSIDAKDFDSAAFSSHKIHGPKGLGIWYLKSSLQNSSRALIHGGGQEFGLRSGTENIIAILAFAKLIEYGLPEKNNIFNLQSKFYESVKNFCVLNGPSLNKRVLGNLNLSFTNLKFKSEELVLRLDLQKIAVSSGSACSSKSSQILSSYVLRACKIPEEIASKAIRISFGKLNTEEELNKLIQEFSKLIHT